MLVTKEQLSDFIRDGKGGTDAEARELFAKEADHSRYNILQFVEGNFTDFLRRLNKAYAYPIGVSVWYKLVGFGRAFRRWVAQAGIMGHHRDAMKLFVRKFADDDFSAGIRTEIISEYRCADINHRDATSMSNYNLYVDMREFARRFGEAVGIDDVLCASSV